MISMEDRWLSVDEICQYLGISNDTVYRWIERQGMPAHRMGRLWKFKKDEVDGWVKDGGAADAAFRETARTSGGEKGNSTRSRACNWPSRVGQNDQ